MRLRPPALDHAYNARHRPGRRPAPDCSCGYDLRPSITRTTRGTDRAVGLRLGSHTARSQAQPDGRQLRFFLGGAFLGICACLISESMAEMHDTTEEYL